MKQRKKGIELIMTKEAAEAEAAAAAVRQRIFKTALKERRSNMSPSLLDKLGTEEKAAVLARRRARELARELAEVAGAHGSARARQGGKGVGFVTHKRKGGSGRGD
jgi:hypothetical protein